MLKDNQDNIQQGELTYQDELDIQQWEHMCQDE